MDSPLQVKFRINKKTLAEGAVESAKVFSDEFADQVSEKIEQIFKNITQNGERVMQLGGLFADFFMEFSEAAGDVNKINDALDRLKQKSDFLKDIEKKSGVPGLLNELNIKNLDKLLKKQDELLEKERQKKAVLSEENKLIIKNNAELKKRDVKTLSEVGNKSENKEKILSTVKGYIDERVAKDSKYQPKDQSAQLELLDISRKYSDLLAAYQKVSQEKFDAGSEQAITQQLEIVSILKELKELEERNPVLTGFRQAISTGFKDVFGQSDNTKEFAIKFEKELKSAFENGFSQKLGTFVLNEISNEASTVELRGVTKTINESVNRLVDKLEHDIVIIYDNMVYIATGMAAKKMESIHEKYEDIMEVIAEKEEKMPPSKKKITTKAPAAVSKPKQVVDDITKYFVSLEDAKENIDKLINDSAVKTSGVSSANFDKIKDLVGYIQGYVLLGGKLEELNLNGTNKLRFGGKDMKLDYAKQLTDFKSSIMSAFEEVNNKQNTQNYGTAGNARAVGTAVASEVTNSPSRTIEYSISNKKIDDIIGILNDIKDSILKYKELNFKNEFTSLNNGIGTINTVLDEKLNTIIQNIAAIVPYSKDNDNTVDLIEQSKIASTIDLLLEAIKIMKLYNVPQVEHGLAWNSKTGEHTNPILHGESDSFIPGMYMKDAKNIEADNALHTHDQRILAMSAMTGDLAAWFDDFLQGINTQYIVGLKNVLKFDAKKFYGDSDIYDKFSVYHNDETQRLLFDASFLDDVNNSLLNIKSFFEYLKKIDIPYDDISLTEQYLEGRGENYTTISDVLYDLFNNNYSGFIKSMMDNIQKQINETETLDYSTIDEVQESLRIMLLNYLEDVVRNNKDKFTNFSVEDIAGFFKSFSFSFSEIMSEDVFQQATKDILDKLMEKNFGIKGFYENYTQTLSFEDFEKEVGATITNVVRDIEITEPVNNLVRSFTLLNDIINNTNTSIEKLDDKIKILEQDIDRINNVDIPSSNINHENFQLDQSNISFVSPTQTFDNEIQQNLVMLENYKNTLEEIDKLKLEPKTDETKHKLEELNKLADYFASRITVIRSENNGEINKSMMYFNGLPNENLRNHYTSEQIKAFDKVAGERLGLNINGVSTEFSGIDQEIQNIESKSEALRHSLNAALSESRDYVKRLSAGLLNYIDSTLELKTMTDPKDIQDETVYINHLLEKYPELEKFKDKFTSYGSAKDFVKSDEWNDFLATLPKAHTYLEELGYDFERLNRSSNETPVLTEPDEPINQDSSPAPIKVKPILNPQEFADEVSEQLIGHEAKIGVTPEVQSPLDFVKTIHHALEGWVTNVNVDPIIDEPSKFSENVSYQIQFNPAQIPVVPLSAEQFDSEGFAKTVTNRLAGETAKIDVEIGEFKNEDMIDRFNGLRDAIKEVQEKVGLKTEAFSAEQGVVTSVVDAEKDKLKELQSVIEGVTTAVEAKTKAFANEAKAVSAALTAEAKADEASQKKKTTEKKKELTKEEKEDRKVWDVLYDAAYKDNGLYDLKQRSKQKKEAQKEQKKKEAEQKKEKEKQKKDAQKDREKNIKTFKDYQEDYDKLADPYNAEKYPTRYLDKLEAINNKIQEMKQLDVVNPSDLEDLDTLFYDLSKVDKLASQANVSNYITKIEKIIQKNTNMSSDTKDKFETFIELLKDPDLDKGTFSKIVAEVNQLEAGMVRAKEAGKSLFQAIKEKAFWRTAQYVASFFSFQDIIRYGKQAVNTVRELDTALVDLKKTTQMSNTELDDFYYSANGIAKQMGVTTKEIISQAAAWSRLGFSAKDQVEKMSALSSQFASISPGMNVDTATDGLVSSMKAFGIEVDDVERTIMDNINRIGKLLPKHMVTYGITHCVI